MVSIQKVSKNEYDEHIKNARFSYLQKSYWGELKAFFHEYSPSYYIICKDGNTIGGFTGLERRIGKGPLKIKITYIPRTTLVFQPEDLYNKSFFLEVLRELKSVGRFTLLDFEFPYWNENIRDNESWNTLISNVLKQQGIPAVHYWIQPHQTLVKQTLEEDMLASIPSSNAKRNCKRGQKKLDAEGVTFEIKEKLSEEELIQAYALITEVSSKKNFNKRSFKYFQKLQELPESIWYVFKDKTGMLILANYGIINERTSSYSDLYVGRDLKYDASYISYVLKLRAFEYLRDRGIKFYDHWGVDFDPKSDLYLFSLFKQHFGGTVISYPPIAILSGKGWGGIAKGGTFLIKLLQKIKG